MANRLGVELSCTLNTLSKEGNRCLGAGVRGTVPETKRLTCSLLWEPTWLHLLTCVFSLLPRETQTTTKTKSNSSFSMTT